MTSTEINNQDWQQRETTSAGSYCLNRVTHPNGTFKSHRRRSKTALLPIEDADTPRQNTANNDCHDPLP